MKERVGLESPQSCSTLPIPEVASSRIHARDNRSGYSNRRDKFNFAAFNIFKFQAHSSSPFSSVSGFSVMLPINKTTFETSLSTAASISEWISSTVVPIISRKLPEFFIFLPLALARVATIKMLSMKPEIESDTVSSLDNIPSLMTADNMATISSFCALTCDFSGMAGGRSMPAAFNKTSASSPADSTLASTSAVLYSARYKISSNLSDTKDRTSCAAASWPRISF
mmetsp:Transcript_10631/g.21749  ORF Transcript_10631/g.21749 Transcript_10631/m.21749 type:complete len:226 (-) Transcript_10631:312-989(-)